MSADAPDIVILLNLLLALLERCIMVPLDVLPLRVIDLVIESVLVKS